MSRILLLLFVIISMTSCMKLKLDDATLNTGHKSAISYKGNGYVKILYYDKSNNLENVVIDGEIDWREVKDVEIGDTVTYYIVAYSNNVSFLRVFSQEIGRAHV